MHVCIGVCMRVTKSAQGAGKLIVGVIGDPQRAKHKNVSMASVTLTMRSKCGGHKIYIGHISGNF